jgi:hypothetical protein
MSSLSQADPIDLDWWTQYQEDELLASIFAADSEESPLRPDASVLTAPPHRLRRAMLICLCAVVVGAALLVVNLVGSGSQNAFAAWTTTTTTPSASQVVAAQSACQRFYKKATEVFKQIPKSLPPPVLIDSRGPFEMIVYAGTSSSEGVCISGASGVISAGASNGESLPAPSDNSVGIPGVGFMTVGHHSVLTYAYGVAGPKVTAVSLNLASGVGVQATVHNGFYAAWWPSKTDVISAKVTTSEGIIHQNFCDIGPNNQGPFKPIKSCGDQ